jgi:hypothetical protein
MREMMREEMRTRNRKGKEFGWPEIRVGIQREQKEKTRMAKMSRRPRAEREEQKGVRNFVMMQHVENII